MSNDLNLPWVIHQDDKLRVFDAQDQIILMGSHNLVAHIVKCVNAHEGLVEALQAMLNANSSTSPALEWQEQIMEAREKALAALAKAQGEGK